MLSTSLTDPITGRLLSRIHIGLGSWDRSDQCGLRLRPCGFDRSTRSRLHLSNTQQASCSERSILQGLTRNRTKISKVMRFGEDGRRERVSGLSAPAAVLRFGPQRPPLLGFSGAREPAENVGARTTGGASDTEIQRSPCGRAKLPACSFCTGHCMAAGCPGKAAHRSLAAARHLRTSTP